MTKMNLQKRNAERKKTKIEENSPENGEEKSQNASPILKRGK
jgi:hypothetical protein